jgi:hypothetical protein
MKKLLTLDSSPDETKNSNKSFSALDEGEILLGRLEAIDEAGNAIISMPEISIFDQSVALSTITISPQHLGRQVALMFTQGSSPRPVIIGLIHSPLQQVLDTVLANTVTPNGDELVFPGSLNASNNPPSELSSSLVQIDGKQLILEGHEEIVLRCGEASITLNKSGKISIRGKYLLSRATGVNRILGGSVQVN